MRFSKPKQRVVGTDWNVAIEASPPHRIALTDGSLDFVSRKQG
jgi:hypothetical protein